MATLLLLPQARHGSIYLPLVLFFFVNGLTEISALALQPIIAGEHVIFSGLIGFTAIPLLCLLAPLFWVYVRTLTSESSQAWRKSDLWHFALAIASLSLTVVAWLLPAEQFQALFSPSDTNNPRSVIQFILVFSVKTIDVLVTLQVGIYIVLIMRRLKKYRASLMQLFASTEHLELRWFNWLGAFMFGYLLLSIISLLADTLFESPHSLELWESLIDLGLITTLAVWSLRQKPGLAIESRAIERETQQFADAPENSDSKKYQNSGLTQQDKIELANKINSAMSEDELYKSEFLSLSVLAKHIGELPSYVTQTLNLEIGESFFEYVNRWRIEDAARRLSHSDQTVLEIANEVGFNSRSSFYKAFKKLQGCTPSAYRKTKKPV